MPTKKMGSNPKPKATTKEPKEPKEWSRREQYMLYSRGFMDGAGCRAYRHEGIEVYNRGYAEGQKARGEAVSAFCEEIGYKPTILRAL